MGPGDREEAVSIVYAYLEKNINSHSIVKMIRGEDSFFIEYR